MTKTSDMDPLEKRIKELQDELQQVEQPDRLHIWNGVTRIPPAKKTLPWAWAAAAILLLAVGACLGYWWSQSQRPQIKAADFADLPPEWQAKIRECQTQVSHHEKTLRVNRPSGATAADELRELQLLDSLQQRFLADFETLPKDDYRTAERYLHYYEQKIRILELILKEVQIRKHEEERHTPQQI